MGCVLNLLCPCIGETENMSGEKKCCFTFTIYFILGVILIIIVIFFFNTNQTWLNFIYTAEKGVIDGHSPSQLNTDITNILFAVSNINGIKNMSDIIELTQIGINLNYYNSIIQQKDNLYCILILIFTILYCLCSLLILLFVIKLHFYKLMKLNEKKFKNLIIRL
jgi:hypothetical protein